MRRRTVVLIALLALGGLSCGSSGAKPEEPKTGNGEAKKATATVMGPDGSAIEGIVTFVQEGDEVRVIAGLKGAPPGTHGIHLHENGDCGGEGFANAGSHFNPDDAPHACPPTEPRHAGDFGNIEIKEDGTGQIEVKTRALTIDAGPNTVVGKAVILHSQADDCASQPTGDAGGRLACGVVHAD